MLKQTVYPHYVAGKPSDSSHAIRVNATTHDVVSARHNTSFSKPSVTMAHNDDDDFA
jgi:hypothetical protein